MKKEVDISIDEILIKCNIINFRDENAQIKTSVNSKKGISLYGNFLEAACPLPRFRCPCRKERALIANTLH